MFTEGFCIAEMSPNPSGGRNFPWARIVHRSPLGLKTVLVDFLNPNRAIAMAPHVERSLFPRIAAGETT